jgi:hypothetical protein
MELFQGVLLWRHGLSMSLQTSDDGVVPWHRLYSSIFPPLVAKGQVCIVL